jgi:uncharacterized protein YfeS
MCALAMTASSLKKGPVSLYTNAMPENRFCQGFLRQMLLSECLESYTKLDEAQRQQFQILLESESFREAKPLMITTFERGKIEGMLEGTIKTLRETALMFLEKKFGPLSLKVRNTVSEMNREQLHQLLSNLLEASSLQELHLNE